jgi:hypothetical protein
VMVAVTAVETAAASTEARRGTIIVVSNLLGASAASAEY